MDLFVYGTLRSPALMAAVSGCDAPISTSAILDNHQVLPLAGNVVPFIAAGTGQSATGLIYEDILPDQMARLDLYEGAFGYTLEAVQVRTQAVKTREVMMYFPPAGTVAGAGDWSLETWEITHLQPALYAAEELYLHDPLPDTAALRRNWPMMEKRAWARHRAVSDGAAPATLRFDPTPDDMKILTKRPPKGAFFRIQDMDVQHRRFDGATSDVLIREIFAGIDAVLVLPYDPVRDRVLLVEQARMGPVLRGDPNAWTLEPVAGMIDARETPHQAAHRETGEEAGLTLNKLVDIAPFYPSPGSSTDYFHTYLGLCDLPMNETYTGGLEVEAEDLRLHTLGFAQAMALIKTGEITAGPLIMMLYWLAIHRDELRRDT